MRRFAWFLGAMMVLGVCAGAWVTAHADEDAPEPAAPATFEPAAARPLGGDSAFIAIDPQVRPSNGTAPVSSRRTGGLTGRLQALRQDDNPPAGNGLRPAQVEPAAPIAPRAGGDFAPPAVTRTVIDDDDVGLPPEVVEPLPSVLKRPEGARVANLPAQPMKPVASSPSDLTPPPTVTASAQEEASLRVAPSRARAAGATTNANTPAATRPSTRGQTLAAGANASLAVETHGPKAMTLGRPATYTVTIANQGVNEATEVYLAVNLPDHAEIADVSGTVGDANVTADSQGQRLVWKIDHIAGRGQEKLTLEIVPSSSQPIDLEVEWTQAPPLASARVEVLEPKLTMAIKGPKDVLYGSTAVYQIIISNPGTGDAEGVVVDLVSDDEETSDAKPLGAIAAGQQKIIEVSMTASQAGPMTMHFAARSGELMAEAREEVMVRRAKLDLVVEGPPLVYAGSDATYFVQVTNNGDAPAESVQLGTLLPEGSEYLGGIAGVKPKSGQLVWSAGTLAPGKSAAFEFTVLMNAAGAFDVEVQTRAGDLAGAAVATTKVEAVADLKLTVNDPQGPKPVGEEVTYEVTLTNRGTKGARQIAVVVNFSEGIDPVSVEGGTADLGDGQATFAPIVSIEPGASHKLKIKAIADRPGSHVFRAEVRCTDPETRLASEQTTRFFGGATSAAKAATPPGAFKPR